MIENKTIPRYRVHSAGALALLTGLCLSFLPVPGPACAEDKPDDAPKATSHSPQQLEFFENRIRPLLVDNCFECHGSEKSESDLRLDSRAAILVGGASDQPAAVQGDAKASLLIKSVRHEGDYEMPPDDSLTKEQIADLEKWIQEGMAWPAEQQTAAQLSADERVAEHQATHWAFQPIRRPELPAVGDRSSVNNPIDQLVQARLADNGLSCSPAADRRTLIRRATFDLIGLPPSAEEVDAFIADKSPDAYAKLVDRLLASPHYGERWGRHWMDVARYADTQGYALANVDARYPFAYTYRDYVINALNADLPFDQFILQQLAADQLDTASDKPTLAALGFITVGRKYLSRHDTIDDQVDVVTRGLMGLTVGCARCHDHKYDAIPTEDYYSLFGVFENCEVPEELPLIASEEVLGRHKGFLDEAEKRRQNIEKHLDEQHQQVQQHAQTKVSDYLARVIAGEDKNLLSDRSFVTLKDSEVRENLLRHWQLYLNVRNPPRDRVFMPWHELTGLADKNFAVVARERIKKWSKLPPEKLNPLVLVELQKQPIKDKLQVADVYGRLLAASAKEWREVIAAGKGVEAVSVSQRQIAEIFLAHHSPLNILRDRIELLLNRAERDEVKKLQSKVVEFQATAPEELSRAMVLKDRDNPYDCKVMIRGNAGRRGDPAPRRFLAVLSDGERRRFENGAGRLELAQAIVAPENPLTARVIANRIWMHHFGDPLVDTPSDFGIQCERPVQSELLDWLSSELRENGWSLKYLHRTIMLSHAYQQTSADRKECQQQDPENRLLWKMNRRRLEFEALRDSLLAVSGKLDRKMLGKSTDITKQPFSQRRTVYALIDRQDLPNLFRAFDFASPDQSTAKRARTTVPQQALFMLNSDFAIQQARAVVQRLNESKPKGVDARINGLYRILFAREADSHELEIGREFITNDQADKSKQGLGVWQRYAQLLLMTNEFAFVD